MPQKVSTKLLTGLHWNMRDCGFSSGESSGGIGNPSSWYAL